jgi:hypothetical protein
VVWRFNHSRKGNTIGYKKALQLTMLYLQNEKFMEMIISTKLYETAQQIKYASRTDTIPVLNEKASSLSFIKRCLGLLCMKQ